MRHFRAALAGLPLDGEVTAHVETLLHISTAYRSQTSGPQGHAEAPSPPQQTAGHAEQCSCKDAMRVAYKKQYAPLSMLAPHTPPGAMRSKQLAG